MVAVVHEDATHEFFLICTTSGVWNSVTRKFALPHGDSRDICSFRKTGPIENSPEEKQECATVVLEQLDSRAGAWLLYRVFTPSPAVLCQYDATPQLLDTGFASRVGGQEYLSFFGSSAGGGLASLLVRFSSLASSQ